MVPLVPTGLPPVSNEVAVGSFMIFIETQKADFKISPQVTLTTIFAQV